MLVDRQQQVWRQIANSSWLLYVISERSTKRAQSDDKCMLARSLAYDSSANNLRNLMLSMILLESSFVARER